VAERIRTLAADLVAPLKVRGVPRLDFLWGGDELYVNEINTIPGALAWYFWRHEGVAFPQLLADMIGEARRGPTRRFVTDGADGSALRAAGNIAGKLA
jgi:D-alanine-D-alanine ligase